MCNYCGCRALEPIAELTAEHERILNLRGEIRRAASSGDHGRAMVRLRELQGVLRLHDAVEELALYPAIARHPEYSEKVATLFDEHDDVDDVLGRAVTLAEQADPGSADWSAVIAALDVLVEHIDHEEHGLFPAAAIALETADWDRATAVRAKFASHAGHGHPHDHPHEHSHVHPHG